MIFTCEWSCCVTWSQWALTRLHQWRPLSALQRGWLHIVFPRSHAPVDSTFPHLWVEGLPSVLRHAGGCCETIWIPIRKPDPDLCANQIRNTNPTQSQQYCSTAEEYFRNVLVTRRSQNHNVSSSMSTILAQIDGKITPNFTEDHQNFSSPSCIWRSVQIRT